MDEPQASKEDLSQDVRQEDNDNIDVNKEANINYEDVPTYVHDNLEDLLETEALTYYDVEQDVLDIKETPKEVEV